MNLIQAPYRSRTEALSGIVSHFLLLYCTVRENLFFLMASPVLIALLCTAGYCCVGEFEWFQLTDLRICYTDQSSNDQSLSDVNL
jgi:hypothetical protein